MVTLLKLFSIRQIEHNKPPRKQKETKQKQKRLQNKTIILTLTNELNKEV